MLICLIDSNTEYRSSLERVLRDLAAVTHHGDALSALDGIANNHPDLIISAVNLVGPNIFTLLHELRSHSDLMDIPVVLLADDDIGDVSAYGVRSVLDRRKLTPTELRTEITKWI